jgi:hypothetical protein
MSRLNEEFVRIEAISYLSDHYTQKHNLQKISVRKEASVTYRGKKGRADGLLTFHTSRGKCVTVALEAKSRKTFGSLKPVFKDAQLLASLLAVLIAGFVLSMLVFPALILWLRILISIGIGILVSFLFSIWISLTFKDIKRGVVEQLSNYPADYKWVAIPADLYNKYNHRKDKSDDFVSHLRAKKMGLLIISGRGKAKIALEPRTRKVRLHGNLLNKYRDSKKIRAAI